MTDQPTDHRAEAEDWLRHAHELLGRDAHGTEQVEARASAEYGRVARTYALIGIGHALLAEPPERILERRMEALAQLFTAGGPMPTAAAVRAALRGEQMVR